MSDGTHYRLEELIALEHEAVVVIREPGRRSKESSAGLRRAPFRGRGMDYAESRPYAVGDDVRHVDWRVTARTGQLHSKLFHPERDRISVALYPREARMRFGNRACFKSAQAARVGACFLWRALHQGDRSMATSFGERWEEIAPMQGLKGVLRTLAGLERWQLEAGQFADAMPAPTSAEEALHRVQRHARAGARLLLLLDEQDASEGMIRQCGQMQRHHDVLVGLLVDPIEYEPVPPGRYPVRVGETRAWLGLGDAAIGEAWRAHFHSRWADISAALRERGVRNALVSTTARPAEALRDVLENRGLS